ncbi:ZMYM6 protein, partial [Polyodon spathula]|nr:ZMYM6 protein [Polyodon spathula]
IKDKPLEFFKRKHDCRPLPTRTTGEEIFVVLDNFIREGGMQWDRCIGICSDGARAMTEKLSGLVTRVQRVHTFLTLNCKGIHRFLLLQ